MSDLAKTIAAACLEEIQRRPDTPSVDELAEVVRPLVPEMGWDLAEGLDQFVIYRAAAEKMSQQTRKPSAEIIQQAYERVRDVHMPPALPKPSAALQRAMFMKQVSKYFSHRATLPAAAPMPAALQELSSRHDELVEQYLNSVPATGTFYLAPDGSIREIEDVDLDAIPSGTKKDER